MNKSTLSLFAVVCTSFIGCAAPDQDSELATESAQVESKSSDLTVAECATQRDKCLRDNFLFGLFTCPVQYDRCVLSAENGVPAQVAAAISDVAECTAEAVNCVDGKLKDAAGCAAERAECVANVVGVELPPIVAGTAGCIDKTVACVDAAKRVSSIADCATDLTDCAVEQVASTLPKDVTDAISGANKCRIDFQECLSGAEGVAIVECTNDNTACIAGILDVTLPDVPLDEVAECADEAGNCALDVQKPSDIVECAENLSACAGKVIEDTEGLPEQLSCEQKWTACVAKNPFGIFTCGIELAGCKD